MGKKYCCAGFFIEKDNNVDSFAVVAVTKCGCLIKERTRTFPDYVSARAYSHYLGSEYSMDGEICGLV